MKLRAQSLIALAFIWAAAGTAAAQGNHPGSTPGSSQGMPRSTAPKVAPSAAPNSTSGATPSAAPGNAQSTTRVLTFPEHDGSLSPPSTLRITETPIPAAAQPAPVRDTPQSVQLYTQCRNDADRSATSAAAMREAVGRCLDELNQRRAQGH